MSHGYVSTSVATSPTCPVLVSDNARHFSAVGLLLLNMLDRCFPLLAGSFPYYLSYSVLMLEISRLLSSDSTFLGAVIFGY